MKSRILYLLLFTVIGFVTTSASEGDASWLDADKIVTSIKKTSFPDKTFNIIDFGVKEGDFANVYHEEINQAILACSQSGGGTVLIPKGTYHTGPLTLKSNVNLHLEEGAVLKFSTDHDLYFPAVLTRWEGVDCYNARPLIYAYGETNIAITGKGTIDGQGANDTWWYMCGAERFGSRDNLKSQWKGGRQRLLEYAETHTPNYKRVMTQEDALRPQLINLYSCNTILIENVTLLNSPFWVIHPLMCEDLIVRGVYIESHGPNSDGCDPESSKNVLIENCYFNTGDDCIAIKSGRNADGRKWNMPSENIVVRGCEMRNGHGGIVIGSEISGGFRNLYAENCKMDSPELDRVVRIKTNNCRGGVIENIFVRNIEVGQCREAVLKINLVYEPKELCDRSFPPFVRNVNLENITCGKSKMGVYITGFEDSDNVSDINVSNCRFENVEKATDVTGAKNVTYRDLYINGKLVK